MNQFNRLLGITAIGASIAKARIVQRLVKDLAHIITLAIATGFMAGALLIGLFYIVYQGLTRYGLEPMAAQILVALLVAGTIAIFLYVTTLRLQRLKTIPGQFIQQEFPFSSRLNGLADSFLDGLLAPSDPVK